MSYESRSLRDFVLSASRLEWMAQALWMLEQLLLVTILSVLSEVVTVRKTPLKLTGSHSGYLAHFLFVHGLEGYQDSKGKELKLVNFGFFASSHCTSHGTLVSIANSWCRRSRFSVHAESFLK